MRGVGGGGAGGGGGGDSPCDRSLVGEATARTDDSHLHRPGKIYLMLGIVWSNFSRVFIDGVRDNNSALHKAALTGSATDPAHINNVLRGVHFFGMCVASRAKHMERKPGEIAI